MQKVSEQCSTIIVPTGLSGEVADSEIRLGERIKIVSRPLNKVKVGEIVKCGL